LRAHNMRREEITKMFESSELNEKFPDQKLSMTHVLHMMLFFYLLFSSKQFNLTSQLKASVFVEEFLNKITLTC
jgi:hypothetical protein